MFTGIIETTGRVAIAERQGDDLRLCVEAAFAEPLSRGESVAVDGVCLTSTASGRGRFEAIVSPETLSRTTLGLRSPGDRVNLERAMRMGDRLGGHLVQGHVDGVGLVEWTRPEGSGARISVRFPDDLGGLIVMKGSIAIDGVSLTVAGRQERSLEVALIPETLRVTRLGDYAPGTAVNLEVDMVGRYVVEYLRERQMGEKTAPEVTRAQLSAFGFVGREGSR